MVVLLVTLIVVTINLLLSSERVQTWMAQRATVFLSKELGTRVEISRLKIRLINNVVLKGLYIEDLHGDTLIYADELSVNLKKIDREKQIIQLSRISLNATNFKLITYAGEEKSNIHFLLNYFSSEKKDTVATPGWNIGADGITINNFSFTRENQNKERLATGVDFNHLKIDGLDASFRDVRIEGDSIITQIGKIKFADHSGFKVNNLSAVVFISPQGMDFRNLVVQTPHSSVFTNIAFEYENWNQFDHFISEVNIRASFKASAIASKDVAYFARELNDLDRTITFTGDVRGRVDQLKGRNVSFSYGKSTTFTGNVSLTGLPHIHETYIDLVVNEFYTSQADLVTIPVPPFADKKMLELPANIKALGRVKIDGKFNGFPNDFVAYGNLHTSIGHVSSDINLKYNRERKTTSYNGHVAARNFELGTFLSDPQNFGSISLDADINGSGFTLDDVNANLKGSVHEFFVKGYNYKNIVVDGQVAKGEFQGQLNVADDNVDLAFDGSINMNPKLPEFDLKAKLTNTRLAKLNLIDRDPSSILSADVRLQFSGNSIDNVQGTAHITNFSYAENSKNLNADTISISSNIGDRIRTFDMSSDVADISLVGDFNLASLPVSFEYFLGQIIETYPRVNAKSNVRQNFSFDVKLKNTNQVTDMFLPVLTLANNTTLKGEFKTDENYLTFQSHTDKLEIEGNSFDELNLVANTTAGKLFLDANAAHIVTNKALSFDSLFVSAQSLSDGFLTNVRLADFDTSSTRFNITANTTINANYDLNVKLLPGQLLLNNTPWQINANNQLLITKDALSFTDFAFSNKSQFVQLTGIISDEPADKLNLTFTQLDLVNFKPLLAMAGLRMTGLIDGYAQISSVKKKPQIDSNITIENFKFGDEPMGTLFLTSVWDRKAEVVLLNAIIMQNVLRTLEISGTYNTAKKSNNIDFTIDINKLYVKVFEPFVRGVFSELKGVASGRLKLIGSIEDPTLLGKISLQKTSFTVDYLKTRYSFADEIVFDKQRIAFRNMLLNDSEGNTATASGAILHDNFKKLRLDFTITTSNLQVLDTKQSDNELFYGSAYASGLIAFSGPVEKLKIDVAAKSEKGTQIFIPLNNPEEVYATSFIHFISHDTIQVNVDPYQANMSGIELNLELEITPAAEVQLIFDPQIGDIIKGNGSGNLRLEINTLGDFNMYGTYVVESGDYLFTLQNVINKRFRIARGGVITWSGDPYDAIVDINAVYKLKASMQELFPEADSISSRVPVNVILNMKNKLLNPNITFDIEVPTAPVGIEDQIQNLVNNEQDMNRQVFSLLVMNRFAPPSGFSSNYNAGVSANVSELLSNQLSNWISQISNDVNLGVNYRAGDAVGREEVELMVSTEIFNQRLILDGNVGVAKDQYAGNIVGDFTVEYKVSPDGRLRLKAFNRSNNTGLLNNIAPYTQGVGIFYGREFNSLKELLKRVKSQPANDQPLKPEEETSEPPVESISTP